MSLEIKCPLANYNYYYQIQMALTNSASCDFVVWTSKDIRIEDDHTAIRCLHVNLNAMNQRRSKIYNFHKFKKRLFLLPQIFEKH